MWLFEALFNSETFGRAPAGEPRLSSRLCEDGTGTGVTSGRRGPETKGTPPEARDSPELIYNIPLSG
ncbi:hypothetical protein EYF80_045434 [Liparis tanakae]|uniref:Uncharacterized protein n=1 Tax=Liparis tanakae TaxID=230148 RepID=A0A4Z2FT11_9TELE|nr:hypothetical protein EYF80_045434 [Liparis tanakae]